MPPRLVPATRLAASVSEASYCRPAVRIALGGLPQGPLQRRLVLRPLLLDLLERAPTGAPPGLLQHLQLGHQAGQHGLQRLVHLLELRGGLLHHRGFCLGLGHPDVTSSPRSCAGRERAHRGRRRSPGPVASGTRHGARDELRR